MAIKTFINRLIQSSSLYFGFENTWWKVIPEMRAWRGCDHMVVRFATSYAISAYHHWSCEFESHSWRGVLDTTLCEKVGEWLATGWRFSLGAPVCSTNNTDRNDISEISLKVALITITLTLTQNIILGWCTINSKYYTNPEIISTCTCIWGRYIPYHSQTIWNYTLQYTHQLYNNVVLAMIMPI